MSCCPTCGADRERDVVRGQLRVSSVPPAVFWRGEYLGNLSPVHMAILKLLARHGKASHLTLSMACPQSENVGSTVKVHVCHLRNRLPAGIALRNIHGWGYELELED